MINNKTIGGTVLITGGTSGIGLAFAKAFARDNYNVVIVAPDKERLMNTASHLSTLTNGFVETIACDLSNPGSAQEVYDIVIKKNIVVTTLINNAGFATAGPFLRIDISDERDEMTLNMVTPTLLAKLFGNDMALKGKGKILNIASLAGFAPGPHMAVYYATKSYLLRFSIALAYELKDTGVNVTALCPGPVATHFAKRAHITQTRLFSRKLPTAEKIAEIGMKGLANNKIIVFDNLKNSILARILPLLPLHVVLKITDRLNRN